jgi:hypothetical protein
MGKLSDRCSSGARRGLLDHCFREGGELLSDPADWMSEAEGAGRCLVYERAGVTENRYVAMIDGPWNLLSV